MARSRSSWPLGMDRQISPTHSSFTPTIGLALKLLRLTTEGDFPALDGLQIAFAGLEPDHGLFAVEARQRMALVLVDHDHVAALVFGQHRIANDLEGDGLFHDRERQRDVAEAFRGNLFIIGLDHSAGADAAHDRREIELKIFHDRNDFRRLHQALAAEDLRHRAGPHAHGRRQAALALARLLQAPLDHCNVQHGDSLDCPSSRLL